MPGKDKPRVFHILGNLVNGGIANVIRELAAHPKLSDYRHGIIAIKGVDAQLADQFSSLGVSVHECLIAPRVDLKYSYRLSRWLSRVLQFTFPLRLSRLLKRLGADIVHTHSFSTQNMIGQARGVASLARLPWVWTVHGYFEIPNSEIKKWRKGYALAKGDCLRVTADSQFLADLVKTDVLPEAKIQVVYPGVDLAPYARRVDSDLAWRVRNRIPASAVLFGSTGRLTRVKGFDVLLRAAALLHEQGLDIAVVVAGKGELFSALEKQSEELGLVGRVRLIGFQEDLPAYLRQLDVFILPSRSEGFPLSLLEALASGLPCIAARVGGVPEMLAQGIVVAPEDPRTLADAMKGLLDAARRKKLAEESQRIVARYSMEKCSAEFAKIYDSLL